MKWGPITPSGDAKRAGQVDSAAKSRETEFEVASKANPYVGDPRTLEAKKRGYPARSVFKLEEIQKRLQLLRPGMRVLDLGAAPGSWSLFASQKVGPSGRVLAIDLQEITQRFEDNVHVVQGDALNMENQALSEFAPYDVVLSDMAPKTSGIKLRDQAMSFELFERALGVCVNLGRRDQCAFVCKIFMGPDFNLALDQTRGSFSKVKVVRPEGVRPNSKEVYIVGSGPR
jgi:23S rRNA (uridine2552-2'-O)-methyltransferase